MSAVAVQHATVRVGSKGSDVKTLQTMLNRLLVPSPGLTVDGDFGKKTESAVKTFQTRERLLTTGTADGTTWTRLDTLANGSASTPKPPTVAPKTHAPPPPPAPPNMSKAPIAPIASASSAGAGLAWLPNAGAARKLNGGDFDAAARTLGCEAAAVRAVAEIESGGRSGFDGQNRPKILFEAHVFHKRTGGKYGTSHPHLSVSTWAEGKKLYGLDQWVRLREAVELSADDAVCSASWGMFQVMGFNHKAAGWGSPKEFATAMFESEANHLKSFLGFCKTAGLVPHLVSHDWAKFAKGYNGAGYAENKYDVKIGKAYEKHSKAALTTDAAKSTTSSKSLVATGTTGAAGTSSGKVDSSTASTPTLGPNVCINRPHGKAAIIATFGPPGDSQQVNVTVACGKNGKNVPVKCHKLIAPILQALFEDIKAAGKSQHIKSFEGSYCFRTKRGGTEYSTHSWGISVDINAADNPMVKGTAAVVSADQVELAPFFEKWGFYWGKAFKDAMHFQYCTGY